MVTKTVAPVSAKIAGQSPVKPSTVVTRNTALRPSAIAMQYRGIGSFQGDIGAAAHGDSDIGRRQGRRVIDTVADLGDPEFLFLQFAHDALLVLWEQFRPHLYAKLFANCCRRAPIVTGQHHSLYTSISEGFKPCLRIQARFVAHANGARDHVSREQHRNRLALVV